MEFADKIELQPSYASYAEVSRFTGLSVSTVKRLIAKREFPAPVMLSPRKPLFSIAAVRNWAAERERASA